MPWTSKTTCKKILGGHAVLEDMTITMGPGMPPLMFRNVYTWDRVTERHMALNMGNNGEWSIGPVHWTADGKVVDAGIAIRQGKVVTERWVVELQGDTMTFKSWVTIEGGEPFVQIEGTAKRGGDGFTVTADSAKYALTPPSDKLKAISVMLGEWDFTGEMEPAPGAPKMKISGHEKIYDTLGGHVMCIDVVGDPTKEFPMEYRGLAFMAWDPDAKCIVNVGFNNFGEFHTQKVYPQKGRRCLMFMMAMNMGNPMAGAAVMEWSGDGSVLEYTADALMNGQPARRTFESRFTRKKTAAKSKKL
jgi:hypothetical protein